MHNNILVFCSQENTELAVKKGMFGAPTFYVTVSAKKPREMMFFGSDRFEQMAFVLGKPWEGPNPPPKTNSRL